MGRNKEYLIKKNLLNQLQKKILFQSLHNVQSPLSAVSGYLELLHICSMGDRDFTKIDRYRQKIQSGVDEVNNIIEQIRYIENKTIADEEAGDYVVSLPWFLNDLCSQATSFVQNKDKKIVYENSGDECYLEKNISLIRLFLYNVIVTLLKFTSKGEIIKVSNENADSGFTIRFDVDNSERSFSEILNLILTDKGRSFSEHGVDADDDVLQTMDLAMKVLNCTIIPDFLDEKGVHLKVVFNTA